MEDIIEMVDTTGVEAMTEMEAMTGMEDMTGMAVMTGIKSINTYVIKKGEHHYNAELRGYLGYE